MKNGYLLGAMQVFLSVVESGSFSESARRLGLSQPSVSRQINNLEEQLGIRLLQRTTRSISLTEAGHLYYEKARSIQDALTEAHQAISGFKDTPSGTLRVSVPYTWMELRIAPHLKAFSDQYPEIRLNIQCDDSLQDLVSDELDIVIRVGRTYDSSFVAIPLANVEMKLVASPAYLSAHQTVQTVSDLHNHAFVTYTGLDTLCYEQSGQRHDLHVDSRLVTNSVGGIIVAIKQGMGLSLLPAPLIEEELKRGELVELLPDIDFQLKNLIVKQAFAMYPSRKQMPAKVRAFLNFFKERF